MPEVHEEVINTLLADILSRDFGLDARPERQKGRKRPDIRIYHNGFIIGIESSYGKEDAEKDARARVEQGLADIAIALYIKRQYKDVPQDQLREEIRGSKFDVKVFVPVSQDNLIDFLTKAYKIPRVAHDWLEDVDIPTLKSIIDSTIDFIVGEKQIDKAIKSITSWVNNFVNVMVQLDKSRGGTISKSIHDILYKLYGFSVAGSSDAEILFTQAGLSLVLTAAFYEHMRSRHEGLPPITEGMDVQEFKNALIKLSEIDYRNIIDLALQILNALPPEVHRRVKELIALGVSIAGNLSLLKRDFAGRIYHTVSGTLAHRKGFATYYTSIPAAEMLATLSVAVLLGLDKRSITKLKEKEVDALVDKIKKLRIVDFACGSGTLLTASFNAVDRVLRALRFYYDVDIDVDDIEREVIERGIYGMDALRYATQIASINLSLVAPSTIKWTNVYTIYLGDIPNVGPWLGSLELLHGLKDVKGLQGFLGIAPDVAENVSLNGSQGFLALPDQFDLVIMNPPFTRATGRTEQFEEQGASKRLFGFMTDEQARDRLVKRLDEIRKGVRDEIVKIAKGVMLPKDIAKLFNDKEFKQYLNIGQAGEGLLFLYLAYKYVKLGGVIAFVLPRNMLSGITWFLARALLATKFHVKYVIVSSDKENGYNFSESTSLSEVLIIAQRTDEHKDFEKTTFINLLRKPTNYLDALVVANRILDGDEVIKVSDREYAVIKKVKRIALLDKLDNWNLFVSIPVRDLLSAMIDLVDSGVISIKGHEINVPMARLADMIESIGIDRHQFRDEFIVVKSMTPYPVLYSGEESVREKMAVSPNAYAEPKTPKGGELYKAKAGRVLLPDRIRWSTAHVMSLYSQQPLLSNIFYAVKLKPVEGIAEEEAEKALVLWLNTTWGILTTLMHREETEGAWTEVKMTQWKLMPVLDIRKLSKDAVKSLAKSFDALSQKRPRRLIYQFNVEDMDKIRLEIDKAFLKAVAPELSEKDITEYLYELYRYVHVALKSMWS